MERARLISLEGETSVELDVVPNEDIKMPAKVTDYPIEQGLSIADHMEMAPITMAMSGVVVGDDAGDKLRTLRRWREERHRLQYLGRSVLNGYVMIALDVSYDVTVGDGFKFKISLQEVRVVSPYIAGQVQTDPVKTPVAGITATVVQVEDVVDAGRVEPEIISPPTLLYVEYSIPADTGSGIRDQVEGQVEVAQHIPVDKERVPYNINIRMKGETYTLRFDYNSTGDYFTVKLISKGEVLVEGEKVVCGQVLFSEYADPRLPQAIILPGTVTGEDLPAGWDNMGDGILLYLYDKVEVVPDG